MGLKLIAQPNPARARTVKNQAKKFDHFRWIRKIPEQYWDSDKEFFYWSGTVEARTGKFGSIKSSNTYNDKTEGRMYWQANVTLLLSQLRKLNIEIDCGHKDKYLM